MNSGSDPASVRVLVVEDDPDDRELLLYQLRKGGMEEQVKFINDGQEALDFLTGLDPAFPCDQLMAVVLDLKLPSVSGLELLREIRAHDGRRALPVIVLTSSNDPKDLEECKRLEVANFVSKPITFDSFSKAIADVFHLPRKQGDNPEAAQGSLQK